MMNLKGSLIFMLSRWTPDAFREGLAPIDVTAH